MPLITRNHVTKSTRPVKHVSFRDLKDSRYIAVLSRVSGSMGDMNFRIARLEKEIRRFACYIEFCEDHLFKESIRRFVTPSCEEFTVLDVKHPIALDYDTAMLEGIPNSSVRPPRVYIEPSADISGYSADESADDSDSA